MRYVKCGSKMFDPKAVTAIDLNHRATAASPAEVKLSVPGETLWFRGPDAEAVRAYFLSMHATDLLRRDEDEAPEVGAPNHNDKDC